ncbi:MFS transporter [Streptomyces sp. NA02950]|uniref:MFS transporter n=1 Tax=Streptomyces sp. NA02950 TaxID=2742137 RepID=UPI0015910810|nr:MFS transporter [Streptomyces sp. NA02950]QKV96997.1 MFS transporter [Streptomyces sp. NA02950]
MWLAVLAGPMAFGIAGPALILDDVARDLDVPAEAATWAVTAFGWGLSVGTPLMAGLLGHRGMRAALTACGLLVLAGATLLAAIPALPFLVLGSALQALGIAGLTATAMNLADSARRMGVVTAALAVVGSTAPLVGSLVSDKLSWQVAFALPLLSVMAVPAVILRGHQLPPSDDRFDRVGAVLLTALVTALVSVPHWPVVAGVCAAITAAKLWSHLRVREAGFVPAVLVRTPAFLTAAGLAFSLAVINFGMVYAVPRQLARYTDWTTSQIGVAVVWPMLLGGLLSWFVVAASARAPRAVTTALVVMGVVAALTAAISVWASVLLGAQALASIAAASGQGVFAVRATSAVPGGHRPAAIGLFNLSYLLGVAFGPALVSVLYV